MSYDLTVWYEPAPITVTQARAKLIGPDDDVAGFVPHPNVLACFERLLIRFPALEARMSNPSDGSTS